MSIGDLPPAYQAKAQQPLYDTSTLTVPDNPSERAHGAKLTPRLVGSFLLSAAHRLQLHPYWPATLFGVVFLACMIITGARLCGDAWVGIFVGLTFAGLHAVSASFAVNYGDKPFDGIAIGMLGLTAVAIGRPAWMALFTFLACWTDERALMALVFVAFLIAVWPDWSVAQRRAHWVSLALAIGAYFVTLFAAHWVLGWGRDFSGIGHSWQSVLPFWTLAAWLSFEGTWVLLALAVWTLFKTARPRAAWVFCMLLVALVLGCLVVLDISRTSPYGFPLILAALAVLGTSDLKPHLRPLAGFVAVLSLIAPNFEVIVGLTVEWLPGWFMLLPALGS